jgi:hypothetical protein
VADQFQKWSQGSYGKLVLMVGLAMILGSFMFGGGAKMLWSGVGLALIVKYGAQILTTIAGITAEIVPTTLYPKISSLNWNVIFELILLLAIVILSKKYNKLKKELEIYRDYKDWQL